MAQLLFLDNDHTYEVDGVIFSGFCIVAYAYIALAEIICRAPGVGA